jgi:hypothetical protein
MSNPVIVPEDLDGDRDGDLEQRAWSEDEKQEILRRGREIIAEGGGQDILRRDDGGLDEQRTSFSDEERDEILKTARAHVAGYDDEKFEIGDDGDREQRAFSPDEKAEILRTARDTVRRDATTGMITKVKIQDREPEARQPRQRYQRRRRAYFDDPIETTGWPEPPSEQDNLDTRFEDLITARVEKLFAGQHEYILGLLAQVLADSVERDGVVEIAIEKERRHNRREVRKLQAQIENLQHALDELRDAVALERSRALTLPPLLPARSSDLN